MQITWKVVEGTQPEQPAAIDKIASAVYVYVRKNILRKTKKTENGPVKVWEYLEAKLTPEEFDEYLKEIDSPTYQAVADQREELDEANSAIMMQQLEIRATQAAQDEILSMILFNGVGSASGTDGLLSPIPDIDAPTINPDGLILPDIDLA